MAATERLAIEGGKKAVKTRLGHWPQFDAATIKAVAGVLASGKVSFCQNKTFTTGGEGGMVVTDDERLAWQCRSFRDHGYDVAERLRLLDLEQKLPYIHNRVGWNYRMTEMQSVIGSGGIARRRTIPEGLAKAAGGRLVAVYDVDPQANREVAGQFGAVACESEEELLARKDVDAVYIATPVHLHARQAAAAAQAGKHILCEKPLGLSVAEAEAAAAACRKAGVILAVDFMMRFHAFHREARRMIEQGALGRMVFVRAQLSCWYPPMPGAWRQDPATGGGGVRVNVPTANLYKSQIEDVSAAIAGGRQPLCDGAAGLWSQKVLAACYESARTGRAVVFRQD